MLSKHLATMQISQQVSKCIFAKIKVEKKTTKANFSGMNRICEAFLAIFGWQRNKYLFFTHLNLYFTPHIRAKYYTHRRGAGMKVWVVGEQKKKRSHRAHWKHFTEFSKKKIFRFANACCFGAISTSIFFVVGFRFIVGVMVLQENLFIKQNFIPPLIFVVNFLS